MKMGCSSVNRSRGGCHGGDGNMEMEASVVVCVWCDGRGGAVWCAM